MKELHNKKVFITGGAQGIGRELALQLGEEGCEILLSDINSDLLEKSCQQLRQRGITCHEYGLDVSDMEAISRIQKQVAEEVGRIDILINNAGIVFGGRFLDLPLEKHLSTYRVNIEGLVAVTYHFLPLLMGNSASHLVNIASAAGFIGLPNGTTYASSKWAVVGFSESIRAELKRNGNGQVKVTTVCPSYVGTGMFEGVSMPRSTQMLDPVKLSREIIKGLKKDREFVIEPKIVRLSAILRAALPAPLWDFISEKSGTSSSMETWLGRDKIE